MYVSIFVCVSDVLTAKVFFFSVRVYVCSYLSVYVFLIYLFIHFWARSC